MTPIACDRGRTRIKVGIVRDSVGLVQNVGLCSDPLLEAMDIDARRVWLRQLPEIGPLVSHALFRRRLRL